MKPIFIAEIKTQSPFGYKSEHSFATLMDYAITYGDWVSVHTSPLWGGDWSALDFVRRNTDKPILAKGLHATKDDIERALDHGADYVLVVDRVTFGFKHKCLFEISPSEFERVRKIFPDEAKDFKFVYNSRDLRTGRLKETDEFESFKKEGVWVCQASGIRTLADVRPDADAFLVGENLVRLCNEISHD